MPRLRTPLSKQEDINKVPIDQPVDIALPIEDAPAPVEAAEPADGEKPAPIVEPTVREQPELVEPNPLQKQIDDLRRAEQLQAQRMQAERQHREDLERQLRDRTSDVERFRGNAEQAQYDSILNAIAAAKAESETAKRDLKSAGIEQDWDRVTDAQERLSGATARLVTLDDGKIAFEARYRERREESPESRPNPQPQQQDAFETTIAAFPDAAKGWLRNHREYVTDPRKNAKIQSLHWDVIDEGHEQFTPAYFESMESHLGLRQPISNGSGNGVQVSAPPTRDVPSGSNGNRSSTRITLTPEQREMARISGVDELTYVKGIQELEARKKNGHYQS